MIAEKGKLLKWLIDQPDGRYECKPHKEKRSLTANSYYWTLLTDLAGAMRISKEECHDLMLRRYGRYLHDAAGNIVCVLVDRRADMTRFDGHFEYYDDFKGFKRYKVIKGSHMYDSLEFSRLLDGLISDCKALGIQTIPQDEIARLRGYEQAYKGNGDTQEGEEQGLFP